MKKFSIHAISHNFIEGGFIIPSPSCCWDRRDAVWVHDGHRWFRAHSLMVDNFSQWGNMTFDLTAKGSGFEYRWENLRGLAHWKRPSGLIAYAFHSDPIDIADLDNKGRPILK